MVLKKLDLLFTINTTGKIHKRHFRLFSSRQLKHCIYYLPKTLAVLSVAFFPLTTQLILFPPLTWKSHFSLHPFPFSLSLLFSYTPSALLSLSRTLLIPPKSKRAVAFPFCLPHLRCTMGRWLGNDRWAERRAAHEPSEIQGACCTKSARGLTRQRLTLSLLVLQMCDVRRHTLLRCGRSR